MTLPAILQVLSNSDLSATQARVLAHVADNPDQSVLDAALREFYAQRKRALKLFGDTAP